MNEEYKSAEVRRLVAGGRELSEEQRLRLRRLWLRTDELWERREGNHAAGRPKRGGTQPLQK